MGVENPARSQREPYPLTPAKSQRVSKRKYGEVMKKRIIAAILIGTAILTSACSSQDLDTLKKDTKRVVKVTEDIVKYKNEYKDIDVHTEEEMREFALEALKNKYGKEFAIDETYCKYNHVNGHDYNPMQLRARAYPVDDPEDVCGIRVREPNEFEDTYSVNKYNSVVAEYLKPQMDEYGVSGIVDISYPDMTGIMEDGLSAEDIIYDGNSCIRFVQITEQKEDITEYIPTIRKWLEYLYTCDFEWYFTLADENDRYYSYAGISKGDHMYTSADQWTEENLLSLIDACINLND